MTRTYYERPKRIEKLSNAEKAELFFDLINAFSIVRSPLETSYFLQDLLSASEIKNLAIRLRIAKLLLSGETYEEIRASTHASTATITKVSVWLDKGGNGFKNVLSKLPSKTSIPKKLPKGPIEYHLPEAIFGMLQYAKSSGEEKLTRDFLRKIGEKKEMDRNMQEMFDEEYVLKRPHKK